MPSSSEARGPVELLAEEFLARCQRGEKPSIKEYCDRHPELAGLGGDAKSGVTKDESRTFAELSVAALAAAVKSGWAVPSELKEPDFDALWGRADFQKLLAEVEAKAGKKEAESN